MHFGGPEFVLAIIAMAMIAGVLKSWGRARHGIDDSDTRRHRRNEAPRTAEINELRQANARLADRLENAEDRIKVLERIVTDRSTDLAREIEALRDDTTGSGIPLGLGRERV